MYHTWITGTPALRHAAASSLTFSTTFWLCACAGAPESANAPPSAITSFCRSWMMSAVRPGSRFTCSPSVVGERRGRHLGVDAVQRRGARDEEGLPVRAAPRQVADVLRDLDDAEVLAVRADHPDALRPGHPDVAALVALHPVRDALLDHAAADVVEEQAPVRDRAVGVDVV